ncbi:TRAP transporter small permease [Sulfitobacter geojensis]|uniref:TRAP transporter small permease n=1 Tax=Sulfitobacter geojensis TaxID=1342299 RepID=UPI0004682B72|nr:TRAP transporter small permease [Sulfitobacter geojensis]KHA54085.1 TRAP dicarboxylate transporter, DctQ subunit [Sulfitobacter geojensis]NYI29903.1 TRAP-type C4-dicarboxylate transport system permease small subunit [Sulfitobacter geojensis]
MLGILDRWLGRLEFTTAVIGGVTILVLMFLITAEVLSRKLFNIPIRGQVDFTSLSMVTFSLLCISHCYRQAGHIRMDMLQKMTSGRFSWATQIFATCAGLLLITAILPGTWTHFLRAWSLGDTTIGIGLPTWPSKLAAPIGLGILWLRLTLELWVYGRLIWNPDLDPIGVPAAPPPTDHMDA